jgi:hypothetical protein
LGVTDGEQRKQLSELQAQLSKLQAQVSKLQAEEKSKDEPPSGD